MPSKPDFYNPIYYSIVKRPFFRFNFPALDSIQVNYSQLHQDLFVLCALGGKREGVYCEIGSHEPIFISNTYLLEQAFDWRGLGFEWDKEMVERHLKFRRNPCICADALNVDFEARLFETDMPEVIDYLSVDIDPPANSLRALKRLPHKKYRFRVITFQHDFSFGGQRERTESREFLESLGYRLIVNDVSWGDHIVEDWWVDPLLIDPSILQKLTPHSPGDEKHPHDIYFYTQEIMTQLSIDGTASKHNDLKLNKVEGVCIEGWRDLNHSYSLVNQWQLLELLCLPVKLYHRDVAPYNHRWNAKDNASGLPNDLTKKIRQIPAPKEGNYFSSIYRIFFPLDLSDGPAEKIFVFGTSEFGHCTNYFQGATCSEAQNRDNLFIITPSHWSRRGFLTEGFNEDRVFVLPHGISTECFFSVEPELRDFYRQVFGFKVDDFVLLNIGAMTPNKGIDLLIEAFLNLKPKHPRLKLVIKDQSNLYARSLDHILQEMEKAGSLSSFKANYIDDIMLISENLDMEGLRALYNSCDLYVSPYRAEGFNLPPLEAAACGLPILVTKGGSTDDYYSSRLGLQIPSELQQLNPGMILNPSLDALQENIKTMLENSGMWGGKNGSKYIHLNYSWQKIGIRLWDHIKGK